MIQKTDAIELSKLNESKLISKESQAESYDQYKTKKRNFIKLLAVILALLTFASCNGSGSATKGKDGSDDSRSEKGIVYLGRYNDNSLALVKFNTENNERRVIVSGQNNLNYVVSGKYVVFVAQNTAGKNEVFVYNIEKETMLELPSINDVGSSYTPQILALNDNILVIKSVVPTYQYSNGYEGIFVMGIDSSVTSYGAGWGQDWRLGWNFLGGFSSQNVASASFFKTRDGMVGHLTASNGTSKKSIRIHKGIGTGYKWDSYTKCSAKTSDACTAPYSGLSVDVDGRYLFVSQSSNSGDTSYGLRAGYDLVTNVASVSDLSWMVEANSKNHFVQGGKVVTLENGTLNEAYPQTGVSFLLSNGSSLAYQAVYLGVSGFLYIDGQRVNHTTASSHVGMIENKFTYKNTNAFYLISAGTSGQELLNLHDDPSQPQAGFGVIYDGEMFYSNYSGINQSSLSKYDLTSFSSVIIDNSFEEIQGISKYGF